MSATAPTPYDDVLSRPPSSPERQAVIGLRVLLAGLTAFFLLLSVAFLSRSQMPDYLSLAAPWKPLAQPWVLWFNTLLLAIASGTIEWAARGARRQNYRTTLEGLLLTAVFSLAFIGGQLWFWQQLSGVGFGVAGNPANSFFYLFTGLHGVHLLGGLIAWTATTWRVWHGLAPERARLQVRLCATYWHFLFIIWLGMLVLLTLPPDNLAALAAFCRLG